MPSSTQGRECTAHRGTGSRERCSHSARQLLPHSVPTACNHCHHADAHVALLSRLRRGCAARGAVDDVATGRVQLRRRSHAGSGGGWRGGLWQRPGCRLHHDCPKNHCQACVNAPVSVAELRRAARQPCAPCTHACSLRAFQVAWSWIRVSGTQQHTHGVAPAGGPQNAPCRKAAARAGAQRDPRPPRRQRVRPTAASVAQERLSQQQQGVHAASALAARAHAQR